MFAVELCFGYRFKVNALPIYFNFNCLTVEQYIISWVVARLIKMDLLLQIHRRWYCPAGSEAGKRDVRGLGLYLSLCGDESWRGRQKARHFTNKYKKVLRQSPKYHWGNKQNWMQTWRVTLRTFYDTVFSKAFVLVQLKSFFFFCISVWMC